MRYFGPEEDQGHVRAYPGAETNVPIYVLGSSTNSAYLAAELGLPYVFASHFAPRFMEEAISIYRREFKPSAYLEEPYMMVCVNLVAAETDEEAALLSTSMQKYFLNIVRGTSFPLSPPVASMEKEWFPGEKEAVDSMLRYTLMGSKETVRNQLTRFQELFDVDELMTVSYIFDKEKQANAYRILKEITEEHS